jgi:hypothetical protein
METVAFITTETGTDLIVSFVLVAADNPSDIESLTLIRTPIYEGLLDESERGVTVSLECQDDRDLLEVVDFDKASATIKLTTESREYDLDLRKVDPVQLERMCSLFRKMNFDQRLQLKGF